MNDFAGEFQPSSSSFRSPDSAASSSEPFSYSQATTFECSQEVAPPMLQRRCGPNDICGDPLRDQQFRSELRQRCYTNHWPKVEIRHNLFMRGAGLFAKFRIRRGEFVCHYAGIRITNAEYDRLLESADPSDVQKIEEYALGGRTHTLLAHNEAIETDMILKNSFGRMVNHSRVHPNLKAPQWVNLAPTGTSPDWHAVFQVLAEK